MGNASSKCSKSVGCSGCVIEAIERGDQKNFQKLLSEEHVEFNDTYWAPLPASGFKKFVQRYPNCYDTIPIISAQSQHIKRFFKRCTHSADEKSVLPGYPTHIAMSVVFTAMLHSTAKFNALQMLAESQKFDLTEPLVFHWKLASLFWRTIVVDPTGVALLIDNGIHNSTGSESFLLIETLKRNGLLKVNKLRAIEFRSCDNNAPIHSEWESILAKDVLSFLNGCSKLGFASVLLYGYRIINELNHRTFSLLRVLYYTGDVAFDENTLPAYSLKFDSLYSKTRTVKCQEVRTTIFSALVSLFNYGLFDLRGEQIVSELILNGWICIQNEETAAYFLAEAFHESDRANSLAAFRIASQLLALGLFRESEAGGNAEPVFPRSCLQYRHTCGEEFEWLYRNQPALACHRLLTLLLMFFRNPLSLQQLSRSQIRRSVGLNDFERRVKTLPLPPPLLTYVWLANEMLVKDFAS